MKLALIQCDVRSNDVEANAAKLLSQCAKAPEARLCITSLESLTGPYDPCIQREQCFKNRCMEVLSSLAVSLPEHQGLVCGLPPNEPKLLWHTQVISIDQCFQWQKNKICLSFDEQSLEVDLALNLASRPFSVGRQSEWEMILSGASMQSNTYCASLNLVGGYGGSIYNGQSFLVAPDGSIVARSRAFEEDCIFVDTKNPSSARREPLCNDPEQAQWIALTLGLKDFVHKLGCEKAILGLSGGMDSALVACVAAEALGNDNVLGVLMPSQFTSDASINDALELGANLGIATRTLPIESIKSAFLNILEPAYQGLDALPHDLTNENLQARIRGVLLMALANKTGALVLNTGNKSEAAMGYSTLYGDSVGAVSVIGDLFKTEVYKLARWYCQQKDKPIIPENIFIKAPSAELAPNQKDTDSLPPYDILDAALCKIFNNHSGDCADDLNLLRDRVRANAFKRHQSPPVLRISALRPCDERD